MTKVYDALRLAEADRSAGNSAEPGAAAGHAVQGQGTGELEQIRAILVGNVLPGFIKRCGPQCSQVWKQTVGPTSAIEAP